MTSKISGKEKPHQVVIEALALKKNAPALFSGRFNAYIRG
jgi:hypothetical protein